MSFFTGYTPSLEMMMGPVAFNCKLYVQGRLDRTKQSHCNEQICTSRA